jgi:uncharacterized protein YegL
VVAGADFGESLDEPGSHEELGETVMDKQLTEIACVIDRSGSMESLCKEAIGGFNTFLDQQKAFPGKAKLTLVLFDHEYLVPCDHVDIQNVRPLDESTYEPRGTTAMLDAIGRTIDDVGRRLATTPEAERPGKVIVTILTDGIENASKDYTQAKVSKMIAHQQEKYGWQFLFLAANQDAIANARDLSIGAQDAVNFDATGDGVREAFAMQGYAVSCSRAGGRSGISKLVDVPSGLRTTKLAKRRKRGKTKP